MKLIFDNIHGYIELSQLAMQFIDTSEFQRLRNIHQTGALSYVFPTAVHKRFEHSIGTYHLTGQMLSNLNKKQPNLGLNDKLIELVKIGGLCHDLGHCTFSHAFDDCFLRKLNNYNDLGDAKEHEYRSIMLVDHIVKKYDIHLRDDEIQVIKDVISPETNKYNEWADCNKIGKFVLDIVCNTKNNIDVDKFDYIARDNTAIGLKLGFDYSRLLQQARVIDDTICYPKKIIDDIYHMFFVRYRLHKTIYNHKSVNAVELMLADLMMDYSKGKDVKSWINDPEKFIEFTDDIYYLFKIQKINPGLMHRLDTRNLYSMVGSQLVDLDKDNINEDSFIFEDLDIEKDDLVVKNYKIGYVSGNKENPLDYIYLYNSEDLNTKFMSDKSMISSLMHPDLYQERYVRVFCKNKDKKYNLKIAFNRVFNLE